MFAIARLARAARPVVSSLPVVRCVSYVAPPQLTADKSYRFGLKLDDIKSETEDEEKTLTQLKAVLSLNNASQHELNKAQVALAVETFQRFPAHAQGHKKDHHSRRGLMAMVEKRRKLLKYLRRKDLPKFRAVVAALGLRFT
ncbi:30s ribosomal protein s15 [Plasmopara halstedii]|uniref:30s ribosomal protein s15 n=1 Tax=Plasmopara halstedii TaxID=4781 RepID=A0A0P1B637_PLAHL|nr:30s ribosomal protein s15 [Plasmopara halstedii]CEG49674.1 30s ribosomal protein s15 [Plasmopara halstedii]|eukprot:XP_024586043.1 30s ribosomal protein s15 [Plasmopara halstedii]